jgi:hypothetical protein
MEFNPAKKPIFAKDYLAKAEEVAKLKTAKDKAYSQAKLAAQLGFIDAKEAGLQRQKINDATTLEVVNQIINSLDKLLEKE